MARDFGSGASTDNVSVGLIDIPTTFSCCVWVKRATDTGSFPRVFDSQKLVCNFDDSGATAAWRFERNWTDSAGLWEWTSTQGATFSTCTHAAWTYDGGARANDPLFYENGIQLSLSVDTNPPGSLGIATGQWNFYIGNRNPVNGTDRGWGGTINYLSVYNVILTRDEILEAKQLGVTQRGLIGYWKLEGTDPEPDYAGFHVPATVTGTTITTDCPVGPIVIPQITRPMARGRW